MAYDYLSRTEDHLYERMGDIGSEVVTLRSGVKANPNVLAFVTRPKAIELQAGVVITQMSFVLFWLYSAAYRPDPGKGPATPQEGDEFERANGDVYRVALPPESDSGLPFEYTTSSRLRMKVWAQLA